MSEKKKLMAVIGTRPDAIKMCPLINEMRARDGLTVKVCATGQHKEMLYGVLDIFGVVPDYDLGIMREGQDLFDITVSVLSGMRDILEAERPDALLVHGDTTGAFAAALAAFYKRIPVCHVEAGLRTYDMNSPYPEEFNRRGIGLIAEKHFAPTGISERNLISEGVEVSSVTVTGNTVIDALSGTVRGGYTHPLLDWVGDSRLILFTAHRRENRGEAMENIFSAVTRIAEEYPDVRVIYPVHPDPAVRRAAERLSGCERIRLCEPLGVMDFHNLLSRCYLVLTDSGGIQEEAAALGKPVLVARDTTERREGLLSGGMRLVGTKEETVYRGVKDLLEGRALYYAMSHASNPYGDGSASKKIADIMEKIV